MSCRLLALVIGVFLSSATSCLKAQAIRQEEDKPLLPPNLMFAGEPDGSGTTVVGFNIASLRSIPFSGTIEAENQIVDAKGNNTFHRHITKIARDTKGRTRIDVDLNSIGTPGNPKLVTVYIYDAVTKADLTLFPWRKLVMRYEDKPLSQPMPGKRPAPIALEPDYSLGLVQEAEPQIETQRIDLGAELIEGMQVRHGRETSSYPAGFAGHKEAYTVVIDYWYSQELQSFVLVKQLGPFDSVQTLTLRNIRHEDPDRSLFTIPKGYTVQ
jgi:hypothetical protein